MKKSLKLSLLTVSLAVTAVLLIGCTEGCEHKFGTAYQTDETHHWHACENGCGDVLGKEAHSFGELDVTKMPTCAEKGEGTRTCTDCGKTITVDIPVTTNHTYGDTYEHDGASHWRTCTVCNGAKETNSHVFDGLAYDQNNHWNTCVCGQADTATAHVWNSGTVNEDGSTTYSCTEESCKATKTEAATPPAEDHSHSYTEKVVTEATCKEEGVKEFKCSCGSSYTESIAKTAHSYTSGDYIYDDTHHWKSCVCGAIPETKDKHVFPSEPTVEGTHKVYTCIDHCGYEKKEMISVEDSGGYVDPDGWT
ncbi:MAG: hypothetical protein IJX92_05805 [Clostridia bacterium]|nr:hypothetical protein [Clostridia bacterium]